jgi:hypothetical protein
MNLACLVLFTVLTQASPLTTDPQAKAQAQLLLSQGSALYQQGDVAGALEKFEAAYIAFPSPKLMFNIGKANRDLGRPVEAVEAFQRFLAEAPDASPENLADARRCLAEIQKKLGRIRIECDTAGTEVGVDGKTVGLTPMPGLVWATEGRHQITASHMNAVPVIEKVEVKAGSVSTVRLHLTVLLPPAAVASVPPPAPAPVPAPVAVPAPAPVFAPAVPESTPVPAVAPATAPAPFTPPPPDLNLRASPSSEPDQGWWLGRKWTWVAAGSTVLLAVAAISAGISMEDKFNSLRSSCGAASGSRPHCSQSDVDSVNTRKTAANVFWGLTAAAAVTAGALFYWEGRPVTVAPMAGGMTGAVARVGF